MSVHKHIEYTIGIDKQSYYNQPAPLVRASMYPKSDWFSLSLFGKDDGHVTIEQWQKIKSEIDALIEASKQP